MDVLGLYNYAEDQDIDIYWFSLDCAESLSYCDSKGDCSIAMDPWCLRTISEEVTKLAHELGHCETGSFYNCKAALDIRQKHENRADKWAIEKVVPQLELERAVSEGHTEPWDLAEYFNVTEDFIKKAICWYKHGNLAVNSYL